MAMTYKNVVSKVVDSSEVEGHTLQGWRVAEVLQESYVEEHAESVPFCPVGSSYVLNGNATKSFVVTKNKFLMTRDGSTVVAEARSAFEQVDKQRKELADRLIETDKALRERITEVAKLKAENERQLQATTLWIDRHNAERDLKLKMENAIAKVRQAVGELKMKEILGS